MFSANTSDLECVVSITCTYVKDGGGGGGGTEMQGLRPFPVPSLECPLPPISPCIPQHNYSPSWPGDLPRGQADDRCIRL